MWLAGQSREGLECAVACRGVVNCARLDDAKTMRKCETETPVSHFSLTLVSCLIYSSCQKTFLDLRQNAMMKFDWKNISSQRRPLLVLCGIAVVILIFFFPVLPIYFLADDYNYVGYLLTHAHAYVQGELLADWFIAFSAQGLQNPELSIFFRPIVQWLWLNDFIMWGTNAFGYHLTNILLHILNSYLVYLLARKILKHDWGSLTAGLLFALHPIHVDSVAWIADRTDLLSTLFYLLSAFFFVLYRQNARGLHLAVSLGAFALAIGTKENTVALPLIPIAYDFLFAFRGWHRRIALAQILYALILVIYVLARFVLLGQFGRNTGGGLLSFGADLFLQFYVQALGQPFIADITGEQLVLALAIVVIVVSLYRDRRAVWFGLGWILFTLLPSTAAAYVAPRLAYAPSAGLALALAAICIEPAPSRMKISPANRWQWNRIAGVLLVFFFLARYSMGLVARVDDWNAAGTVARIIPEETKKLYGSFPTGSRLQFLGAPDILRGIYIYNDNFASALQIAYQDPSLSASNADKFPIYDDLTHIYFFEYRRRVVTERADITRVLAARQRCLANQYAMVAWNFSSDAQGWQAFNDLAPVDFRDGALSTRAVGTDPYLVGPAIDIPSLAIGDVEIEMSVRGAATTTVGSLFWNALGEDFSPARKQNFTVQADGAMRTYRVDLAQENKLFTGDHVARLRLDPSDMLAEIILRAIRVNVHCRTMVGDACQCP